MEELIALNAQFETLLARRIVDLTKMNYYKWILVLSQLREKIEIIKVDL